MSPPTTTIRSTDGSIGEIERFASRVRLIEKKNGGQGSAYNVGYQHASGALVFTEDYPHRYPHCWRCHNPVIFRATPQWFISMDRSAEDGHSLRAGALREIERVNWVPAWGEERKPEIDGVVHIENGSNLAPGTLARVRIVGADQHDLRAVLAQ